MTVHLVTFSDESMSRARDLCEKSALRHGVDVTHVYTDYHVWANWPAYTIERRQQRGKGFWMWKPWVIQQALEFAAPGDHVIYSDAGVEFINNVSHIIDRMDQDIFLFGNNWEHAHWCKRDVVDAVWPFKTERTTNDVDEFISQPTTYRRTEWSDFGKQCQASVIFFRVSDYSRAFVAEWLKWCLHRERYSTICTDEWRYLIDDSPSKLPNHPEFREHRHDQAILTTLAYRERIKLHYWPAMYNDGAFSYEKLPEYAEDDYPILFHHHRRRDHEWKQVA